MNDNGSLYSSSSLAQRKGRLGVIVLLLAVGGHEVQAAGLQTNLGRLSVPQIVGQVAESVVTIDTPSGSGSGVIIESSGVIVTNLHVIQGETEVTIGLPNGDTYDDVAVVDIDERKDLALLKIKAFGLTVARLGNSDQAQIGDTVVLIGAPRGFDQSVTTGILSAIRDSGEGYRMFQTDAAASPGSSGGGMFNGSGELIGVVTAEITNAENVNFALPINYARGMMDTEASMTLEELAARYTSNDVSAGVDPESTVDPVNLALLAQLLKASAYEFEEIGDNFWRTGIEGDNLDVVSVFVSILGDLLVGQSFLIDTPTLTSDQMEAFLQLNYVMNLAKISIDEEGDIFILDEANLATLDVSSFAQIVNSIAVLTDQVAGLIGDNSIPELPEEESSRSLNASREPGLESFELLGGRSVIRFDSTTWRDSVTDERGNRQFVHVDGDVYIKVVDERIQYPAEYAVAELVATAQDTGGDARVTRQGVRMVNDKRFDWFELEVLMTGIEFVYYAHIYSGSAGVIQLIAWTGRNLLNEYRAAIDQFVAGVEVFD